MSKRNKNYKMTFQAGDIIWLVNEFRKRQEADPSLTLEDFAMQYGIIADELRLYIDENNGKNQRSVTLWHGTSMSRAKDIIKEGFKPAKKQKRKIFFTNSPKVARSYAKGRASRETDIPAIIMCSIDLLEYDNHYWQSGEVLVFNCSRIESDVVKRVTKIGAKGRN